MSTFIALNNSTSKVEISSGTMELDSSINQFKTTTPEKFDIPEVIVNLSTRKSNSVILPIKSQNVHNLLPSTYRNCDVLEGLVKLSQKESGLVKSDFKLNNRIYPDLFKNLQSYKQHMFNYI